MLKGYPSQIKYIVGNEAAERYSFYGMRSILVIYMITVIFTDMGRDAANEYATYIYHMFVGACYLLCLFGGYVSDRFLGKYKTIMSLSIVYCLGNFILAFITNSYGLYLGLALIALGSGGIKPCVSANVGDQFKSDQKDKLRKIFDIFYFTVNFGSFFSTLITPWTLNKFGPQVAFGIPGVLMGIAVVIFWMGRNLYIMVPPTGKNAHGTLAVIMSSLKNIGKQKGFLNGALTEHPKEAIEGVRAVFDVGKTFIAISIFWALFDQHGSTWVLQAKEMELKFMGYDLLPSQIPALNPIMVMLLIPICSKILYPSLEKMGVNLTPLRKMGFGLFTTALAFGIVAFLQYQLDLGNKISVAWQFFPFLIITFAEVLISITGLEFAYTQAPRSMKSTIMSLWLLTVFIGNMITAFIAKMNNIIYGYIKELFPTMQIKQELFMFCFFTTLILIISFAFIFIAKNYKVRNYMEDDSLEIQDTDQEEDDISVPLEDIIPHTSKSNQTTEIHPE